MAEKIVVGATLKPYSLILAEIDGNKSYTVEAIYFDANTSTVNGDKKTIYVVDGASVASNGTIVSEMGYIRQITIKTNE